MDGRRGEVGRQWMFTALLNREWQRALRSQTPISLILVDIDISFEFENKGDHIAIENYFLWVGEKLRECVKRDLDFITRHEKYTFVCLLPDTSADGVRRVCQMIQEKLGQLHFSTPSFPTADQVIYNIGGATVKPTFKLNQDYLLHQAEMKLEEAKKRNPIRVEASKADIRRLYAFK
jgi:diguanylate cyclase (GGDEF)-like protein